MKIRLIERGNSAEHMREIPISKSEFIIGRGADCDLCLWIPSISRHHCLVRLEKDGVTLSDVGSANGTYVNGQRVRSQTTLESGDLITLGNCKFVVELGDQEGLLPEGL